VTQQITAIKAQTPQRALAPSSSVCSLKTIPPVLRLMVDVHDHLVAALRTPYRERSHAVLAHVREVHRLDRGLFIEQKSILCSFIIEGLLQ
jgi:hypothetical protein